MSKRKKEEKRNTKQKNKPPQNTKMGRGKEADMVEPRDFSHVSQAESYLVTELLRRESILQGNVSPPTAVGPNLLHQSAPKP